NFNNPLSLTRQFPVSGHSNINPVGLDSAQSRPTEFTIQLPLSADAAENPIVEAVTVDLSFVDVN
ncbi:MAG: hypothetical protein ACE1ZB_08345, partial [Gammaproteobacteria bacterium]